MCCLPPPSHVTSPICPSTDPSTSASSHLSRSGHRFRFANSSSDFEYASLSDLGCLMVICPVISWVSLAMLEVATGMIRADSPSVALA